MIRTADFRRYSAIIFSFVALYSCNKDEANPKHLGVEVHIVGEEKTAYLSKSYDASSQINVEASITDYTENQQIDSVRVIFGGDFSNRFTLAPGSSNAFASLTSKSAGTNKANKPSANYQLIMNLGQQKRGTYIVQFTAYSKTLNEGLPVNRGGYFLATVK